MNTQKDGPKANTQMIVLKRMKGMIALKKIHRKIVLGRIHRKIVLKRRQRKKITNMLELVSLWDNFKGGGGSILWLDDGVFRKLPGSDGTDSRQILTDFSTPRKTLMFSANQNKHNLFL